MYHLFSTLYMYIRTVLYAMIMEVLFYSYRVSIIRLDRWYLELRPDLQLLLSILSLQLVITLQKSKSCITPNEI